MEAGGFKTVDDAKPYIVSLDRRDCSPSVASGILETALQHSKVDASHRICHPDMAPAEGRITLLL